MTLFAGTTSLPCKLGTRDGWNVFLVQYPEGFYAGLAKGQLNKIAAEEARAAAVEKARQPVTTPQQQPPATSSQQPATSPQQPTPRT